MNKRNTFYSNFVDITLKYNILRFINSGTYGEVYEIEDIDSKKRYSIKISYIMDNLLINPVILREINYLKQLNHRNIIKLYDVLLALYNNKKCICLLIELCDTNIMDYITTNDLQNNNKLIDELLESVQYIHDNHIYHGDLSLNNIMVKDGRIIIIDFGNCNRNYRKYDTDLMPGIMEKPNELININIRKISGIGVDAWTLGWIMKIFEKNSVDISMHSNKIKKLLNFKPKKRFQINYNILSQEKNIPYQDNNIYESLDINSQVNILYFFNNFNQVNDLDDELLYLTLFLSKRIKKSNNNIKYNVSVMIILFWICNKCISSKILHMNNIVDILKYFQCETDNIEEIYIFILTKLDWKIDQVTLYNYISFVPSTYKKYYESFIFFIEITDFKYTNITDVLSVIYSLFRENFNNNFEKIKRFVTPNLYNRFRQVNDLKSHIKNHIRKNINHQTTYLYGVKNIINNDVMQWLKNIVDS